MDDATAVEAVGLQFLQLANRVRRVVDARMTTGGLSLTRTKLLSALDEQGPTRLSTLAEQLEFAARSVTETVEILERDGFVERRPDPTDRRAKLVAITREGTAVLATANSAGQQVLQDIFGPLGDERTAALGLLLSAIETTVAAAAP